MCYAGLTFWLRQALATFGVQIQADVRKQRPRSHAAANRCLTTPVQCLELSPHSEFLVRRI